MEPTRRVLSSVQARAVKSDSDFLCQHETLQTTLQPTACPNIIDSSRVLCTGGGEAPPPNVSAFPQKFCRKKLQLFQIKIFFDDDFKESVRLLMSRNVISANSEHYIFKISGEHAPGPP